MKKVKSITVATTVALMALLLALCAGCNSNPTEVAKYVIDQGSDDANITFVFYSNNTCSQTQMGQTIPGTYRGNATKAGDVYCVFTMQGMSSPEMKFTIREVDGKLQIFFPEE